MAGHKKPLQLWKQDSHEPENYNKVPEPQVYYEDDIQKSFSAKIAKVINMWLANRDTSQFDKSLQNIESEWVSSGGARSLFEILKERAFLKSEYYKKALKI